MNNKSFAFHPIWSRLTALCLVQVAVLGLMIALAMPASAADGRAIKSRKPPFIPRLPGA